MPSAELTLKNKTKKSMWKRYVLTHTHVYIYTYRLAELKSWLCLCHRQDLQHHCQVAFVNKERRRTDTNTHTLA